MQCAARVHHNNLRGRYKSNQNMGTQTEHLSNYVVKRRTEIVVDTEATLSTNPQTALHDTFSN